jgi:hypothetical protein
VENFLEKLKHLINELIESDKKLAHVVCHQMQLHDKLLKLFKDDPPSNPGDGNPGGGGPLE